MAAAEAALEAPGRGPPAVRLVPPDEAIGGGGWGRISREGEGRCSEKKKRGGSSSDVGCVVGAMAEILPLSFSLFFSL